MTRPSLPTTAYTTYEKQHEYRWLTVLGAAPPSTDQPIYALHERGFAGHMLRSSTVSRFYLCNPMQYGHVFLAGDAAHIIAPAGGKGMNLALADGAVFVEGVRAYFERNDDSLLASYSQRCLPRIWRAEEFSHWMLSIMNPPSRTHPDATFMHQLQIARLDRLRTSRAAATSFAQDYVGYDLVLRVSADGQD